MTAEEYLIFRNVTLIGNNKKDIISLLNGFAAKKWEEAQGDAAKKITEQRNIITGRTPTYIFTPYKK